MSETTPPKARIATVWLGGCSGCHMSFLDTDEWLFEFAERAELVYSPLVDIKEFPSDVDVTLVEAQVMQHNLPALATYERLGFQQAGEKRHTEGGMVNVGVAGNEEHVKLAPTPTLHLCACSGQECIR